MADRSIFFGVLIPATGSGIGFLLASSMKLAVDPRVRISDLFRFYVLRMCFACVAGVHAAHLLPLFCHLPTLDSCRNIMGIQVLVLNTGKKYHGFDLEQALMGTCVSAKKQLIVDSVWPCLTHA